MRLRTWLNWFAFATVNRILLVPTSDNVSYFPAGTFIVVTVLCFFHLQIMKPAVAQRRVQTSIYQYFESKVTHADEDEDLQCLGMKSDKAQSVLSGLCKRYLCVG